jgi:transcriptional regulator of acetoin/glycerol metabolism
MLPTAYPYDRKALLNCWKKFIVGEACEAHQADAAVARSWQRCRKGGIDAQSKVANETPLDAEALEDRLHPHFDLIAIARPFMEDTYQFVGERGVAVLVTDRDLCILDLVGDAGLCDVLASLGIQQGAFLWEASIGTNAAAMALYEGIPVQVAGAEHYCVGLHTLTDTAAPVHAPQGEMLGVVGMVTREKDGSPQTLGVVMAAAKAIENQLKADLALSEAHQHLAELDIALEAVSKGIVYLSPEGRVTHMNARAGEILDIRPQLALGREIAALLTLPPEVEEAMQEAEPLGQREVIFERKGKAYPCVASMNPLPGGDGLAGYVLTLEHSAEVRQLVHHMVGARAVYTFDSIVGRDVEMRKLLRYARSAAQADASVLLLGEIGTGKELFAQAIHNASRRAKGAFVSVNCAAVPRDLLAVSLFGCEAGTLGATEGRPGKFELADGGTIFLQDVDGLPLEMQAAVVNTIDTRETTRLGGARTISVDVRVIAASSNLDLGGKVQQGQFRADLFYRLHVLTLTMPPLRERGNDLLLLIAHLTERLGQRLAKVVKVTPAAMVMLQSYHWPGNVRELENVLEQAMYMVEGDELKVEHLPRELSMANIGGPEERVVTLEEAERQAIIRAGRAMQGNVTAMAQLLGIGRTTLWRKMKAFRMSAESFKG